MTPIPTTLDEAVDQLVAAMSHDQRTAYAATDEDYPGSAGFLGGMAMRNGWRLWQGEADISLWLKERRVVHGDDQSLTILRALWRRLHGLPIDDAWIATEAAAYETFWRETAGLTWDMQPIPGFMPKAMRWLKVTKDGLEDVEAPDAS